MTGQHLQSANTITLCTNVSSLCMQGGNSSVSSALDLQSCEIQHRRFDTPQSCPAEAIFPLVLTYFLTQLPTTLLDDSMNRGLVCACMHSTAQTPKIRIFMSWTGEWQQQTSSMRHSQRCNVATCMAG